jgi:aminopeptidase
MLDDYNEKLAKLVVHYSVKVQKDDKVTIRGGVDSVDLVREIQLEVIKAGGQILTTTIGIPGGAELYYKYAQEHQLKFQNPVSKKIIEEVDKSINVFSSTNRKALSSVDPSKIMTAREASKELQKLYSDRVAKGEIDWVICPFPAPAFAQEGNMGTFEYKEFVYKALALDKEDPVEYWKKVEEEQAAIVEILKKGKELRIVGEDTDLTLGIEGRGWINACGQKNLPDGEVFTSPIEDAVNGTIRFTYPGIYMGNEVENIWLKFKDGKVVEATASKGQELLDKVLEMENADILGEVAIGTNYGIQRFTKNMLFDEKMGGTIHLALGNGFKEIGSKNESIIHWDILKEMKSDDSVIYLDGKEIYKAGKWFIP